MCGKDWECNISDVGRGDLPDNVGPGARDHREGQVSAVPAAHGAGRQIHYSSFVV